MNDTLFSLSGHTAMVTGASSGLGRTFASVLAAAGASVVLTGRRMELLEQACAAAGLVFQLEAQIAA